MYKVKSQYEGAQLSKGNRKWTLYSELPQAQLAYLQKELGEQFIEFVEPKIEEQEEVIEIKPKRRKKSDDSYQ